MIPTSEFARCPHCHSTNWSGTPPARDGEAWRFQCIRCGYTMRLGSCSRCGSRVWTHLPDMSEKHGLRPIYRFRCEGCSRGTGAPAGTRSGVQGQVHMAVDETRDDHPRTRVHAPNLLGMAIVVLSGAAGGAFAFPLRVKGRYAEKNTPFGAYALATLVLPLAMAWLAFPPWPTFLSAAGVRALAVPLACGIGWGLAALSYAQAISRIGLALTVSVVLALSLGIGSVVPLLGRWADAAASRKLWALAGIGVGLAAVVPLGVAWRIRDGGTHGREGRAFRAGLLWSVLSGMLSPLANIGFDAGAPIAASARVAGVGAAVTGMLQWFPTW